MKKKKTKYEETRADLVLKAYESSHRIIEPDEPFMVAWEGERNDK